ncbi:LysM peptidoglycan-binding domain-containing protein [Ichthyenterobacterium sp. W332]|uniref:LysM peptidoglycan-binding domain-containing protein n=1 Tax=Microcosmobacter mediterraneus TaxID=3075607 RepID=A0ABU2YGY8_9FLAO|nr:LysM peptidoglycan-binding domain-containing protein [Ichthyenterobacterium sp. W332]MDT0557057.1 LysM peptidoglycan-binding domain-containing protein [Ichthyenterobacterium sp. W332]
MKKVVLIAILFFINTLVALAQGHKTHKVKAGETIESIASKYLVTPFDIFALNPDAKSKFQENMVLIIPNSRVKNSDIPSETKEVIGYKNHKVKRKETLFSISQKYKIEIDEIKKYNTFLYAENLRKGDKLRIPRFKTIVNKVSLKNTVKKYTVLPKEGKWRVAYKFGITVDELEALNPNIKELLQPGDELNVPNIADNEELATEESFNYYEVLPKEGFYRLKIKLGLTEEELTALNPQLKDLGLKAGMVLKIPSSIENEGVIDTADIDNINLVSSLSNFNEKKIAVLLPFKLNRLDIDTIAEVKDIIRKDRMLSVALDFHSGVLMALDSAKQLGISTRLKVFDTQNQISKVSNILDAHDFSQYDAVIGPLMSNNFDRMANALKSDGIPAISPLTSPKKLYDNVFQTVPSQELLERKMVEFVQNDSTKVGVVIIADQNHRAVSNRLKSKFPEAKQLFSRKNKEGQDKYHILIRDIEGVFKKGKTIVFIETENEAFVSNITSMLNGLDFELSANLALKKDIEVILVTTDKNSAFEGQSVSNVHLSNLKFHYPSPNKEYDNESNGFVTAYKKIYSVAPNKYAVRGFDLTLDVLLRLASKENLYEASDSSIETEYLENKFRYSKKLFGGYYNESAYVVKYDNLKLVEAKQ